MKCNIENSIKNKVLLKVGLKGFQGGHSGKDISKKRGNPIEEMGKLLNVLEGKYNILLKNIYGGRKVNVIPRECYCDIYVEKKDIHKIKNEMQKYIKDLKKGKQKNFENIELVVNKLEEDTQICFDLETTKRICEIINSIPNGVYYKDKRGNPLISLNIGKIEKDNNVIKLSFSIRSNRKKIELELIDKLQHIVDEYNIQVSSSELSGYEHYTKSEFINECKSTYKELFGIEPKIVDMHICLEAGFFGMKKPDLDFVAIGANIYNAHSPKEVCSISSLRRIFKYVVLLLENEKK